MSGCLPDPAAPGVKGTDPRDMYCCLLHSEEENVTSG